MLIKLSVKPLTINLAYRGRRFKSKALVQFQKDVAWLLRGAKTIDGEVELRYKFYLQHYAITDVGNCEKTITDCLVEYGIISDDRFVKKITMEKFKAKTDSIEIEILPFISPYALQKPC